ncbi:MAG: PD40 domain-containing protein, partial [Pseudomonadales bacterium]|nr:PD40 domain-containing protein [Pseudomonadales bacterium]
MFKVRLLCTTAAALACLSLAYDVTAAGRGALAITHEDLWLMKRVGAPRPSPDGRWLVVAVTDPAYDPSRQMSDLWLVTNDGHAPPRRLTSTRRGEGDVVWSRDSTRIAFSTQRDSDAEAQIYLLD